MLATDTPIERRQQTRRQWRDGGRRSGDPQRPAGTVSQTSLLMQVVRAYWLRPGEERET